MYHRSISIYDVHTPRNPILCEDHGLICIYMRDTIDSSAPYKCMVKGHVLYYYRRLEETLYNY